VCENLQIWHAYKDVYVLPIKFLSLSCARVIVLKAVNNTVYVKEMLTNPVLCSSITKTAISIPEQLLIGVI